MAHAARLAAADGAEVWRRPAAAGLAVTVAAGAGVALAVTGAQATVALAAADGAARWRGVEPATAIALAPSGDVLVGGPRFTIARLAGASGGDFPCGNGFLDPGEACGDGNLDDDGCDTRCRTTGTSSTTLPPPTLPACAALDCDDGEACTVDACSPASGCVHEPVPTAACALHRLDASLDAVAATLRAAPRAALAPRLRARLVRRLARTRAALPAARAQLATPGSLPLDVRRPDPRLVRLLRAVAAFVATVGRGVARHTIAPETGEWLAGPLRDFAVAHVACLAPLGCPPLRRP